MAIKHLLKQGGAAAGHANHQRNAIHHGRARREPWLAAGEQCGLRVGIGNHSFNIKAFAGGGVQVFRQCKGAAVLARGIEHADGVESSDAACHGKRVAACEGFQSVGGAGGVRQCGHPCGEDRRARVVEPRAAAAHQCLQFLPAPGAVEHFREHHGGVRGVG